MVIGNFIKESAKRLWQPGIAIIIIYIGLVLLPYKNVFSINALILTIALGFKLCKEKPNIKEWCLTIIKTIAFVTSFFFMIRWLGTYGLLGAILIILIFVAYRIVIGWKLYKYTCVWGADMLLGKKKRFDINELEQNNKNKKR